MHVKSMKKKKNMMTSNISYTMMSHTSKKKVNDDNNLKTERV
jgi:hypothetical protein